MKETGPFEEFYSKTIKDEGLIGLNLQNYREF